VDGAFQLEIGDPLWDGLRYSLFFRDLSSEDFQDLVQICERVNVNAGDPLFLEMEQSDRVYFILSGSVEIVKFDSRRGFIQRISMVGPGDCLSELSVLTGSKHSTSAYATAESELVVIKSSDFLEFLAYHPLFQRNLILSLGRLNHAAAQEHDHFEPFREGLVQLTKELTSYVPLSSIDAYRVVPLRLQGTTLLIGMRDANNMVFIRWFQDQHPEVTLKICLLQERDFQILRRRLVSMHNGINTALDRSQEAPKPSPHGVLRASFRFQSLSDSMITRILAASSPLSLSAGQVLFEAGDPGLGFYIIQAGGIELRSVQEGTGYGHVANLVPGDVLGEVSLLLKSHHSLTARALVPSEIAVVSPGTFEALLTDGEFGLGLARILAFRLQRSNAMTRFGRLDVIDGMAIRSLANLLPRHVMTTSRIVPLEIRNGVLHLGTSSMDLETTLPITNRYLGARRTEIVLLSERKFRECLAIATGDPLLSGHRGQTPSGAGLFLGSDAVQDVDLLFEAAVRMRASDIHIESQSTAMVFRFRIDGELQDVFEKVDREIGRRIINRVKILANLDIAEVRLPQDGQISLPQHEALGVPSARIAIMPSAFGEKIVLRFNRASISLLPLDMLTPDRRMISHIRELTGIKEGVIFVTGPTGCGKTSTLYAMLSALNRAESNIVSVEDPVEAFVPGVTQIPVKNDIGRSYSSILRHILRQDPDVIMIGEVRDAESARFAFEAAMTGHLVLTTVHGTDGINVIPRLLDLGGGPTLVCPGLAAVISQRLLRGICGNCCSDRPISAKEIHLLQQYMPGLTLPTRVSAGDGCERCHYTGYYDRLAVFDYWRMTPAVGSMMFAGRPLDEIAAKIIADGFTSLFESGLRLALSGVTTIDEVVRNCPQALFSI
jgi:type II secretory ATPase GspE/PulE/Tfp pilus assembly ATPase PilB-like protein/CRP-like cAMP-binding protein